MSVPPARAAGHWLGVFALGALLLASCSGGGRGGGPTFPTAPWGRFRHDSFNSGLAGGAVSNNPGAIRWSLDLREFGGATISSPAIGIGDVVYIGTGDGLLALTDDGVRWRFTRCGDLEVGAVQSSPAVTIENVIVVGSDRGYVFGLRDEGETAACEWAFRPADASPASTVRSSPLLVVDPFDQSLTSVFVGTSDGYLQALNGDGSDKWRFPRGADALAPLTASPAIGADATLYLTTPDGFLQALDLAGRRKWRFPLQAAPDAAELLPSPAVSTAVYAVGTAGQVVAVNPDGTLKWRYQAAAEIRSSPAYASQTIEENGSTAIELIVYVVDHRGTLYGIRDSDGRLQIDPPVALPATDVQSSPALSGDLFALVGSGDGRLFAAQLDGTEPCAGCADRQWPVEIGAPIRSSPAIGRDGTIYLTADDGFLRAIGSPKSP